MVRRNIDVEIKHRAFLTRRTVEPSQVETKSLPYMASGSRKPSIYGDLEQRVLYI